jgi:hypothetical protein
MNPSRILAFAVLLAWGVQVILLWPMPDERTESYRKWALQQLQEQSIEDQVQLPCDNRYIADTRAKAKRIYQAIVNDPTPIETEFWVKWSRDLAMLLLGVAAATLMIRRARWWSAAILLSTFFYLWRQGFLVQIYGLFFQGITDIDQFVTRLEIFTRHPAFLSSVVQFDLLTPVVLIVASGVAIHGLFCNWRLHRARRKNRENSDTAPIS